MRSVPDAQRSILEAVQPLAPIELPLQECHGCVLAADVVAEYDVPPFSSSSIDGYAARAADIHTATADAPVALRLAPPGDPASPTGGTVGWGEAVRVAAGGPLPTGADCVIPPDRCRQRQGEIEVVSPVEAGRGVLAAGRDARAGEVLVPLGRRLSAPEIAALANAGEAAPLAYPKVRVAVMSISEGLAEPGRPAALGQPREAGSYALVGALRDAGAVPYRVGIVPPNPRGLREAVVTNLSRADCFVTTMGATDADLEPSALEALGVDFDEVAMHPGASYGFGIVDGAPFFVLPASPVSTFVAFEVLVRPAVLRMMGRRDVSRPEVRALLDEAVGGQGGAAVFAPARVEHREGAWRAAPTRGAAPESFSSIVEANGLVVIPPGDGGASEGDPVRVRIFRPLER